MVELRRKGRTVIATGGVSTPCLEQLQNGDLLVSYRRYRPEWNLPGLQGWDGQARRSRDGGRTWSEPVLTTEPQRPDDPPGFLPYHGMLQLPDGTVLLPCRGGTGGVFLLRSQDNGESWTGPDRIATDLDGVDWSGLQPYGKLRLLSDGTLIMPVWGRFSGSSQGFSGHLRSIDGGQTWDEFISIAHGLVSYNETIELPDGRLMAIVGNEDSVAGHGMAPLLWLWSEDFGRTWSEPEVTNYPMYGASPSLFMTKKGVLICGYRWTGDLDQGFVGGGYNTYSAEEGWEGVWNRSSTIVWLGGATQSALGGRSFAGYPSFAYADEKHILCAYFMSWMGGGNPITTEIEGVYYAEVD